MNIKLLAVIALVLASISVSAQWSGTGNKMFFMGKVGIGTANPKFDLTVNGTIASKSMKMDSDGWADFVFAEDYDLRPLEQLELYILENKRLPEIPSESEIVATGYDVNEMNILFLQKIEELTLYTIQQNKLLLQQAEQIELLKTRLELLEN